MNATSLDDKRRTKISKFLSLVLRHNPDKIGITLNPAGWTPIGDLIHLAAKEGMHFSRSELDSVVAKCPKQRFAISDDGLLIRANQGHSHSVDLGYSPATPPPVLYHGTHPAAIDGIQSEGLKKMSRHHVHLSPDRETALKVGQRRGRPLLLEVNAERMNADGYAFFCSANGVWLTDHVPPRYLMFPAP